MDEEKREDIYQTFKDRVNMAPKELAEWLETDESKSVGQKDGGGESTGHRSGRRIVEIKRTNKDELSDADYEHMQEVNGYIARHLAQEPKEVEGSDWLYSLKNWGHDPTKA